MLQRCHPGYKTKCLVITESVIDSTYSAACQCNFGDFVSFGSDCRHRETCRNMQVIHRWNAHCSTFSQTVRKKVAEH